MSAMAANQRPSHRPIQVQRAPNSFLSALIFRNVPEQMGVGGLMSLLVGLRNQLASKGGQQSGYLFCMTSIENVRRHTWVVGFSNKDAASGILATLAEWLLHKTHNIRAEVLVNIRLSEGMTQSAIASQQPYGMPVTYPALLLIPRLRYYGPR